MRGPNPCKDVKPAHLVVVGQLLPALDAALGVDDNVLLALYLDNPGHAVGVAAVVDEASHAALQPDTKAFESLLLYP